MKVLRTPDARFANLPDYPIAPHDHQLTPQLRLRFVDEGRRDAPPVLMLHGEPTWSYLYRHMIEPVANANRRSWSVYDSWHKPFICCFSDDDGSVNILSHFFHGGFPVPGHATE
ncbi:MAG: hypothetical protein H6984_13420 [Pseudomonadales bacterium]|nr:hypothetical protein [Halioglobus sp.]MCP5123450.1 hypothetical protein [Pseudomonadales bacterium]MCP5193712.1 hypothetical protein [Pseudomonadales bacterium]